MTLRMLAALATLTALPTVATGATADFAYRFSHADAVIVATVCRVDAVLDINQYGDQLIVSRVSLCPESGGVLKGDRAQYALDVEGGTLNGTTLELAHLPLLRVGDRALFLLERGNRAGAYELAGDGLGFFELDATAQRLTDYYSTLTISMSAVRATAARLTR